MTVSLSASQRDVLSLMSEGQTLCIKTGGFFPGVRLSGTLKRINARTAQSLIDRKLVTRVSYDVRDGGTYAISSNGRKALES